MKRDTNTVVVNYVTRKGVSLGAVMAVVISWSLNHSFWWALLHGMLGWIYILYWWLCL